MKNELKNNQGDSQEFNYHYSSISIQEKNLVKRIRSQYLNEEESKMARLLQLDEKAKRLGLAVSISLGVVGILSLGLGLTMVLEWNWGTILGIIGLIATSAAYPANNYINKKQKEKYAHEIIRLSEELLNDY